MRIVKIAVGSALAACLIVPTVGTAQARQARPTFATCDALANARGVTEFERRSTDTGASPYRQFMVRCLAGEINGTTSGAAMAQVQPLTPVATRMASKWDACDALANRRGVTEFERRSTDTGASPYRQFMVACLAGRTH